MPDRPARRARRHRPRPAGGRRLSSRRARTRASTGWSTRRHRAILDLVCRSSSTSDRRSRPAARGGGTAGREPAARGALRRRARLPGPAEVGGAGATVRRATRRGIHQRARCASRWPRVLYTERIDRRRGAARDRQERWRSPGRRRRGLRPACSRLRFGCRWPSAAPGSRREPFARDQPGRGAGRTSAGRRSVSAQLAAPSADGHGWPSVVAWGPGEEPLARGRRAGLG